MAIDVNNANFKMFTDFAATAKQRARAQFDSNVNLNGEVRNVKIAGGHDFIGNVGRRSKYKTANDAVRQLFRETVAGMFGCEEDIPESVLKAMKFDEYGKGKPPGRIASLIGFATGKSVKLDAVKRLKPSSGLLTITKAMIQIAKNIKAAFVTNDIKFGNLQGEIANPQRNFVSEVMLLRLGPSKLRNVQSALTGNNAAQLNYIAREISTRGLNTIPAYDEDIRLAVMGNRDEEIPLDLSTGIRDAISFLATFKLNTISSIIGEILDEEVPEQPKNNEWSEDTLLVVEKVKDLLLEHPQIFHEA